MILIVHLYRDSVEAILKSNYSPKLFGDFHNQAMQIASPFFMMGFHLIKYELVEEVLNDQSSEVKQGTTQSNSRQRYVLVSEMWSGRSNL